jgi:serine phosphatase RsbU (regulator of sigma subunit)
MSTKRSRAVRPGITSPRVALWAAQAQSAITGLEEQLALSGLETAELRRELYEVAQMQRYLCGSRLVRRGSFEIAAELFPVRHLSGDFFSISDLGPTTMLAIGDICGKGLLTGMWFIHILELTKMYCESTSDPAAALRALNRTLCATRPSPPMTSIFLAYVDCSRRELLYSNAGHPAPVLLRADGTPQLLSDGGPVLGVIPDAEFQSARLTLEPGDTLVAFSDGLPECRNERDEEFETARIVSEIQKATPLSTSEMLFSIVGAAQDFAGTHVREDDCTLMVARCMDAKAA